jgi:hypothetical protein
MDEFLEDLKSGEIQFRDKWQFELKSEFSPKSPQIRSIYTQEFYFFIPNSLQIRPETYSKEIFYVDLTNYIRYKTPHFTFRELIDPKNERSPFFRLETIAGQEETTGGIEQAIFELKLFGNIFRSALRERTLRILQAKEPKEEDLLLLCSEIEEVRNYFIHLQEVFANFSTSISLKSTFAYVDEFISNNIDFYLTGLFYEYQKNNSSISNQVKEAIGRILTSETLHRDQTIQKALKNQGQEEEVYTEQILYRSGLLKKFVIDALMLPVDRSSMQELYGHYISSFAAGIAMLIYVLLIVWQGQWFLINSAPFLILSVIGYVLKDRIKEWLKNLSYQKTLRFFPDYTTKILTSDKKRVIGELKESFTFVSEKNIPKEIWDIRNAGFHSMIETFKRPEQIIYFKRTINIFPPKSGMRSRLVDLNIILRFNLKNFLEKASEPYHTYTTLDPETLSIRQIHLPKVYHINIILKNTFSDETSTSATELKKLRFIVDKNGIKHIEQI